MVSYMLFDGSDMSYSINFPAICINLFPKSEVKFINRLWR